jgi:hypothetical protein
MRCGQFFDIGDIKYWHVSSYAGAYVPKMLPVFEAPDGVLLRGIRLLWIFTFELLSKESAELNVVLTR